MKKVVWIKEIAAAAFGMVLLAAMPPMISWAQTLPEGVYVGNQSLGGMTEEEARAKVQEYVDGLAGQTIILDVDGTEIETTAGELGFHWANTDAVQVVSDRFQYGSLVQQYMAQADVKQAPVEVDVQTQVDDQLVTAFVNDRCRDLTVAPRDASIIRENGAFQVTPSVTGRIVDIGATEEAMNQAMTAENLEEPLKITAVVAVQEPAVKTEDLETIQDVLGTFTTDFSSSGSARSTNLAVGAAKINGRVVMPGQTLSGYECLQPFTRENGYKSAAAYENGQVVDSIGGGVCQIATTLYNTALQAELEITQRQNHSMIVTYVKPSMDAAIAGTYKDIKITNNYSTPIYVEGYTENKKLTFTIYGKETRPANRTVEYVSETLGTTSPGEPQLIVDNSLAPGARVRVQSSHTGLRSRLWKVVTVDGVETERTLLHTDSYNASKAIYRVGPTPVAAPVETAPAPTDAVQPTEPQVIEGVNGGPGVTAPAQTEAPAETAPAAQTEAPAPAPEPDPQSAAAPAETAAPEGAAVVPVAQAAEFGNREALG
ncbi:MAG TPA: VanW family protein [Candidatus Enterocloster excrementigallinarum]|uniref:VanW family protein n=1 Tax=Candidatus Enterocloster excrementigallinarum TaxID=2838558 RepID=A0A9D2TF20_9FIRM|nr:VanW family protein [Candidatus Enterocloster excrementigallinarum]